MSDKKLMGRPPLEVKCYHLTDEQKTKIIDIAVSGGTLIDMADSACISPVSFYKFRQHDPNFENLLNNARQEGIHHTVDRLTNIHEEFDDPQVMRVVSDNIKWRAGKLSPKTYGDNISLNVTQTLDIKGALDEAKSRVIEGEIIRRVIENKNDDQES